MTPGDQPKRQGRPDNSNRNPGANPENCVGVVMVYSLQPYRERVKDMAESTVNGVFKKCPHESTRRQRCNIFNHDLSLSRPRLKA